MTVIAWDGKILAADRRNHQANLIRTATKLFKVESPNRELYIGGITGSFAQLQNFINWMRSNQKIENFPDNMQEPDCYANALVIGPGAIVYFYENSPYPTIIEDKFTAIGSGRDFAIAAMHCGKTAIEAVEITCIYDCYCGNGIDSFNRDFERAKML